MAVGFQPGAAEPIAAAQDAARARAPFDGQLAEAA
jgi:hypothetical protein